MDNKLPPDEPPKWVHTATRKTPEEQAAERAREEVRAEMVRQGLIEAPADPATFITLADLGKRKH